MATACKFVYKQQKYVAGRSEKAVIELRLD